MLGKDGVKPFVHLKYSYIQKKKKKEFSFGLCTIFCRAQQLYWFTFEVGLPLRDMLPGSVRLPDF